MNRTAALALILLVASPLSAQLPAWTTLTPTNPSLFFCESSILAVEDATGFHVWSSYTRTYSHLTVGPNRQFYGQDDSCVIIDAATNTAYGYATHLGVFRPLQLNGTPTLPTPNTGATWMVAVQDGNDVHVFSCLLGTWTSMHFGAAPTVKIGRMVTVASDGVTTAAVSAHHGTVVPLGFGSSSIDAVGYCGAARDGSYYHLFSAYRNAWHSVPASANAVLFKPPSRAGYVVVQEPGCETYYSALTGSTAALLAPASAARTYRENVATVQDGNTLVGYSCATGTFSVIGTSASWTSLTVLQELACASDGIDVYALGVLGGDWVRLPHAGIVGVDLGVALASDLTTGDFHAFSCMTNAWSAAPAGTYASNYTTYNGAILIEASGSMQGFSANRGTWTAQAAPPADSYYKHKAAFCARSGTRLDTFNGRTGAWATVQTAVPATVTVFDMAVMADDGSNIFCYDCYVDDWSSQACVSTQRQLRDECAYAYDGTTVYTWSGSPQVTEWANIPEYWRILARGGRMNVAVAAEPNSLALVPISLRRADQPTPYGTLRVDLNAAWTTLLLVPPLGTAQYGITIPDRPWLRGLTLYMQGAIITPSSQIYLTDYFESTIM